MKKSFVTLLLGIPFAFLSSSAIGNNSLRFANSALNGDAQTADPYILKVLQEHEREFPGAIRHEHLWFYTSLSRLSTVQQRTLLALQAKTDFAALWQAKKEMSDITATVTRDSEPGLPERVLNAFAWGDYKYTWGAFLRQHISGMSVQANILARLKQVTDESIRLMKANPRDGVLARDTRHLIAIHVMVQNFAKGKEDLTYKKLKDQFDELGVGALDYLHDPLAYQPALAQLEDPQFAEVELKMRYDIVMQNIYRITEPVVLKTGQRITLREVHPNIAIFRGYVGNDCATLVSPGFVFTPYDRYYYIFDEKGIALGYLGLSLVTIKKKTAVFIHTIQGPDITSGLTEVAMRAMVLAAPKVYGTDLVVLGPDHSIGSNVNFEPIRATMHHAVAKVLPEKMKFADHKIRNVIANNDSSITYDDPKRNDEGRKLEFANPEIVQIEIENKKFDAKFQRPTCETLAAKR